MRDGTPLPQAGQGLKKRGENFAELGNEFNDIIYY